MWSSLRGIGLSEFAFFEVYFRIEIIEWNDSLRYTTQMGSGDFEIGRVHRLQCSLC